MDDADKRESDAAEQTPSKIKAEENAWYLLATLYGVPVYSNDELQAKNRAKWNRYFAGNLDGVTRTKLTKKTASYGRADAFLAAGIAGGRNSIRRAPQDGRGGTRASG
jgi:hypothetical protein